VTHHRHARDPPIGCSNQAGWVISGEQRWVSFRERPRTRRGSLRRSGDVLTPRRSRHVRAALRRAAIPGIGHRRRRALGPLQAAGEGWQPEPHRVEHQESSAATACAGERDHCCGFRRASYHARSAASRARKGERHGGPERGSNPKRASGRSARTGSRETKRRQRDAGIEQRSTQTGRAAERQLDCSDGAGISSSHQSPPPTKG
jgi:hypothetical protein